jgi:transcriptional regulator with GAF, ATPase, and Fis domain
MTANPASTGVPAPQKPVTPSFVLLAPKETAGRLKVSTSWLAKARMRGEENTRLLNELRESLQQQTATAKVLQVISTSTGELEPVFQAMLENATRICGAHFGSLWRFEDGAARLVSNFNHPPAFAKFLQQGPHRPGPHNPITRVINTSEVLHIADYRVDQAYLGHDPLAVAGVELGGIRSLLVVPMVKDSELLGAIGIFHQEVRPFNEKQIYWFRTSLVRPLSLLRMRACSTSYVNRCNSRPLLPMC